MKFNKIGTRMLVILLSVSIVAMIILSVVSYSSSKTIIKNQIEQNMEASLDAQINNVLLSTNKISVIASQIAKNVGATYTTTSLEQYEYMLGKVIFESDLALGSGIWFEPYVYDKNQEYVGPYIYKDGDKAVTTYDYSNKDYDYFSYDWYKNAMGKSKEPIFTPLYYDETLDTTMSSCSVPIYDKNDTFIGVITVDIEISAIQDMINSLTIGKTGSALLLNDQGTYITNKDSKKVMTVNITEDENASVAALGKEILSTEKGTGEYTIDGMDYEVHYDTIPGLGWKLLIQIPKSEINQPLNSLLLKLLLISGFAILLTILVIISQVQYLTKNIKKVNQFVLHIAEGDFTTAELEINSRDELGQMGTALNRMLAGNKSVIKTIADGSSEIREVSDGLEESTGDLMDNFDEMKVAVKEINEDMMSSSAITEEINASVEEMNASINILAQETSNSYDMAIHIKDRASDVEKRSVSSYKMATEMALQNEENLNKSIEEAKIVDEIEVMASIISQLADQVNLLSLNASIEAARAGDQGKGFAVVANEIGKLADKTTKAVNEIRQTTGKVQLAFDNILEHSKNLLSFIQETVTPDYKTFVNVGNQYKVDANDIQTSATKLADMTRSIEKVINEVGEAIQGIAASSENTANNSSTIITHMDKVAELVDTVAQAAIQEKKMSNNLDEVVKKFTLK